MRSVHGIACLALAAAASGQAATITVGPGGTHATVHAAIDHAVYLGETSSVRIATGTFVEQIRVRDLRSAGLAITISGGWNSTFTARTANPSLTFLDGQTLGRTVDLPELTRGTVVIENLTIRRGRVRVWPDSVERGAGLRAVIRGGAGLWLRDVHVRENTITAANPGVSDAEGAGAFAFVDEGSRFLAERCVFERNSTVETGSARLRARGAGLFVEVVGGGSAVRDSQFIGNAAVGSEWAGGGGLETRVSDLLTVGITIEDSRFEGNVVSGQSGGSGMYLWAGNGTGSPNVQARRNQLRANRGGWAQVVATSYNQAVVEVRDSVMGHGDRGGVVATSTGGITRVTNVTAADNDGIGIRAFPGDGEISVFNSIAYSNLVDDLRLEGTARAGANLAGVNPRFIDPAGFNYRTEGPPAPAANTGDDAPPGGLGPQDVAKRPRVAGGRVDIGAHEYQ
jgi:hypothetical protein